MCVVRASKLFVSAVRLFIPEKEIRFQESQEQHAEFILGTTRIRAEIEIISIMLSNSLITKGQNVSYQTHIGCRKKRDKMPAIRSYRKLPPNFSALSIIHKQTLFHFSSLRFYQEYFVINPLNTKSRLLYLKTQFVPRSKHFSSRL